MEAMREAWTDERLDDLSRRMDRGFDRVDADLRALNGRFDALQQTLNALQRTMLQVGVGLVGALLAVMVTVVGLAITQV
ncbi:MAG TPA: hypothetical protein VEW07_02340 [Solirubrobacterales bacterium]|nr:hypothetical protein [Solirubrobacterales bacterium]